MIPILYLAPVDWTALWQRPQQVAQALGRRYRVHYVEPVGLRGLKARDLPRVWRRLSGGRRNDVGLSIVRPWYLPCAGGGVRDLNRRWLLRQMRAIVPQQGQPWILWIASPSLLAEAVIADMQPTVVVYDCMDRYAAFHRGEDRRRIIETERAVAARADRVFATSSELTEDLRRLNGATTLLPNGVDFERFCIKRRSPRPAVLRGIRRPILGFHGTLGPWVDCAVLEAIARRRADWSLVFAGTKPAAGASSLFSLPNVHYLGVISYDELPQVAAHYDVGLVPFVLNELTRCVHPIKALEYLALGLPVVATPLPDLRPTAEVVRFAVTPSQWIDEISACLRAPAHSAEAVAARREAARGRSWRRRIAQIEEQLDNALGAALPQSLPAAEGMELRRVA